MFKQSTSIVVALLVLGLAAGALGERPVSTFVCDTCKSLVEQTKTQIPMLRAQLEQLCNYCGSEVSTKKCVKAIDDEIEKLEKQTPLQFCKALGLCKKGSLNDLLGR